MEKEKLARIILKGLRTKDFSPLLDANGCEKLQGKAICAYRTPDPDKLHLLCHDLAAFLSKRIEDEKLSFMDIFFLNEGIRLLLLSASEKTLPSGKEITSVREDTIVIERKIKNLETKLAKYYALTPQLLLMVKDARERLVDSRKILADYHSIQKSKRSRGLGWRSGLAMLDQIFQSEPSVVASHKISPLPGAAFAKEVASGRYHATSSKMLTNVCATFGIVATENAIIDALDSLPPPSSHRIHCENGYYWVELPGGETYELENKFNRLCALQKRGTDDAKLTLDGRREKRRHFRKKKTNNVIETES